ncbi:MAG TPA: prolyl oligopeptidase family serine peptidase [Cyclobacteriaceae bacterium]|nr:prolyl oligopeptidase family serine peptidase [Cyclobacteriaceae bacterium]HNU42183.1 prolyl oligopeptidase family serine peptidase [Cyclobacteriaceae bacterium]
MKKILYLLILTACSTYAQENIGYQRPPEAIAKLLEAPLTPFVSFSPDKQWMLLLDRSDFPTIEQLSRPELRIGGLRINPQNFGPSRSNYTIGLKAKRLNDGEELTIKNLPDPLLASNISFSPDSRKIAFLQNDIDKIELWLVDVNTLTASKLTERKINNVMGGYTWLSDSQQILFAAVPENLKPLPEKSRIPTGPVVEENLGKKAPSRTYQDLLKNPYDEAAFDYYTQSDLVLKNISGSEKTLNTKAIHSGFTPSPDGKLILTEIIQKPYSYLVPAYLFPTTINVVDLNGKLIKEITKIPLLDYIPTGFNATQREPRAHTWRADKPATLVWAHAQDGGDPKAKADIRDKVYMWDYPFSGNPKELISLPLRFSRIAWGNDNVAWVYERWVSDRKERVYQVNPTTGVKKTVFDRNYEDAYNDPGNAVTTPNQYGRSVLSITNNTVFLTGAGSSPAGDLPFLDKMDLNTGKKTRLWQCAAPYYETFVTFLDSKKGTFVTSRESNTENPNYYTRTVGSGKLNAITSFPHPYPQLKDVTKQVLKYKRADGVELTADLYLPPGYKKEDGPLPGFVWAYPREFKSAAAAGQVKGSPHTFTRLSWGGPIYWVMRGYAVLDNASMPIVGEGDKEPNDTYVTQLVASAKAVVDYGTSLGVLDPNRVGVGGHSYGAFMTANLLAHSDIFKAGIARSGAYNRTLTPFGFQAEERTYWQAPEVYNAMSPFSYADKLKEPILFIHGEADNNSGTFPIQTERFYNAIKGHGGTARYVVLPYESHGYAAKESIMHTLWEMDTWLENYVKNPKEKPKDTKVNMKY